MDHVAKDNDDITDDITAVWRHEEGKSHCKNRSCILESKNNRFIT